MGLFLTKKLLYLLVLSIWFLCSLPSYAHVDEEQPFLAVFVSPDMADVWTDKDYDYHPDIIVVANTWDDFDPFLKRIKKEAKHKKIDLEILCHGTLENGIFICHKEENNKRMYEATMGFVVNEITNNLPVKKVTCYLESCFADRVYQHTIRGNPEEYIYDGSAYENFDEYPAFPIIALSHGQPNWGNLVYLCEKHHVDLGQEDVRVYEIKLLELPDTREVKDSTSQAISRLTFIILHTFGKPQH